MLFIIITPLTITITAHNSQNVIQKLDRLEHYLLRPDLLTNLILCF